MKGKLERIYKERNTKSPLCSRGLKLCLSVCYRAKGDHDRAIADYDRAIQLQPDGAESYYNRRLTYKWKGEKEKAVADFKRFLEMSNDPYLRQQAEEQLKALGAR